MSGDTGDLTSALERAGLRWQKARAELVDAAAKRDRLIADAVTAGLSLRQIAALSGITHGAVQQIIERAADTLHEAMLGALAGHSEGMTPLELAAAVERVGWRRPSDGKPPGAGQVSARANKYPHLFDIHEGRIRVR
jgi:hypothetical protein